MSGAVRLWVLSDLHLEEGPREVSAPEEFDVLVLAGDVHESDIKACVETAARLADGRPAVTVLGNHDLYGLPLDRAADVAARLGRPLGVHVLERSHVDVAGLRFAGGTLWEDVLGRVEEARRPAGFLGAVRHATMSAPPPFAPFGEPVYVQMPGDPLRPATYLDVTRVHKATLTVVDSASPDVVVTHYPPGARALTACVPGTCWVHGHLHTSSCRTEGGVEILVNAACSDAYRDGYVHEVRARSVERSV